MNSTKIITITNVSRGALRNPPSPARAPRAGKRAPSALYASHHSERPSVHPLATRPARPATTRTHAAPPDGPDDRPFEINRINSIIPGVSDDDARRSGPKYYRVTRERLEQLREFKLRHGHAFVPYKEPSGLGRWIAEQRYRYQRGLCDVSIYRELSSAGVPLRAFEARWERKFQALSRFHAQRGHAFIQNKDTASEDVADGLYAWVLQQRQLRKQGRLSDSRRRRLDALGFVWDVQQYTWRENMGLLRAFHEEHGHVRVFKGWNPAPKLYLFTRKIQQSSKLDFADVPYATREDIEELHAMGAVRRRRRSWEEREEALSKCLAANGELDDELRAWLRVQRYEYRQGRMAAWRRRRLVESGVDGFDGVDGFNG